MLFRRTLMKDGAQVFDDHNQPVYRELEVTRSVWGKLSQFRDRILEVLEGDEPYELTLTGPGAKRFVYCCRNSQWWASMQTRNIHTGDVNSRWTMNFTPVQFKKVMWHAGEISLVVDHFASSMVKKPRGGLLDSGPTERYIYIWRRGQSVVRQGSLAWFHPTAAEDEGSKVSAGERRPGDEISAKKISGDPWKRVDFVRTLFQFYIFMEIRRRMSPKRVCQACIKQEEQRAEGVINDEILTHTCVEVGPLDAVVECIKQDKIPNDVIFDVYFEDCRPDRLSHYLHLGSDFIGGPGIGGDGEFVSECLFSFLKWTETFRSSLTAMMQQIIPMYRIEVDLCQRLYLQHLRQVGSPWAQPFIGFDKDDVDDELTMDIG